jgi:hypothetical protein
MKIAKKQLAQIIKEEISRALNENEMTLGQALGQSVTKSDLDSGYPPIKIMGDEELYVQVRKTDRGFAVDYGTKVQHGTVKGSTLDGSNADLETALKNALVSLKGNGVTAETPAKILKGPAPDQSTGMERFR